MRRIAMPAALVFAGALALSGCAAEGGGDTAGSSGDTCTTVASEVRDVSNGVQNTLASASSTDEIESYLSDAQSRVDAAVEEAGDDDDLKSAVEDFKSELDAVGEYAGGLTEAPTEDDPSVTAIEQDPEELAERQTAVQEAAGEVTAVCGEDR
ncbi:hypothetical protein [Agromyces indicus]|uniref:Secreted protein n=1 Tax=Agromyces indicus TaxID=758919 RepID=A0ABU1FI65_9MICO|nr:hypothetical protein [Agromyces indicus]MDR5690960.1 hypothetical protein [Agromyces indicus]